MTPSDFIGVQEHLPRRVVFDAWEAVERQEADSVVSFGGGSAIDLGKALVHAGSQGWALFEGPGPEPSIEEVEPRRLIHVAVPTTYSGAAATSRLWFSAGQEKRSVKDQTLLPDAVLADPDLTLALPPKPTAGTGMTALANCFEVACSTEGAKTQESIASGATALIWRRLGEVMERPERKTAREDLLAASLSAGRANDADALGLLTLLCEGLGGRAGIPHGVAHGILLPAAVMRSGSAEGAMRFSKAMGVSDPPAAARALRVSWRRFGLPTRLREAGVFEEDLVPVADGIMERPGTTPGLGGGGSIMEMLESAW